MICLIVSLVALAIAIISAIVLGTKDKIPKDSDESFIMRKL